MTVKINRKTFFAAVKGVFKGGYEGAVGSDRISGLDTLVDEWEKRNDISEKQFAYILATTAWETAYTMQPIEEYGKGKGRKYGVAGKYLQSQHGRGYVQLTWDRNYEKADAELGLKGKLLKNFNLALKPEIAVRILFQGMKEGWFTGKKLSTYINDTKTDFVQARRIINGVDKQKEIAAIAEKFAAALAKSEVANSYPLASSRTVMGSAAPAAGGTAILLDATNSIVSNVEAQREALTSGNIAQIVIGLIVLGGALVALYARWDDAGRPKFWR